MTGQSTSGAARGPGRPRSEQARGAVLSVTTQLLHEIGLRAMTTEQIARRSGVSKATIYKWWPNKYAVAVEAFLAEMTAEAPDPDTGSAREDFRLVLSGLIHFYTGASGQVFAQLIGESQYDPRVREELRDHLVTPRRELLRTVWNRGVTRGQLRADVDPGTAVDMLIGPILYRLLLGTAPLDDATADALVDAVLRGVASD
ncbi:TetR/AcrR family transcriptional regulator [Mycolicibacterium holsaticum]|uniref:TetR family transcriptional regulator n=1 Tax=Mycolicibacterium holsaticum TaxID=152142 RepID=A0A1E3RW18_9MYCO|nr:TetR/AcrR family transcriptional regulator [Mycolicibacterium holsaticum]ODQ94116.1 TetR family transcriptional regulator [Mycolicibacterium holsaticum]